MRWCLAHVPARQGPPAQRVPRDLLESRDPLDHRALPAPLALLDPLALRVLLGRGKPPPLVASSVLSISARRRAALAIKTITRRS